MLQASTSGQQVIGDVEHVVAVVIWQMDLQQTEAAIDGLVQSELLHQQVHGPNPSSRGGLGPLGDFIMNV